jgi:hypothetical protein
MEFLQPISLDERSTLSAPNRCRPETGSGDGRPARSVRRDRERRFWPTAQTRAGRPHVRWGCTVAGQLGASTSAATSLRAWGWSVKLQRKSA